MQPSNEPLLGRIARGDRSAVAQCVDRYGNLVWSLARRFTASQQDAEDAVQEIFIELWTCASRFDAARAAESSFVAMVARRRLIDRLRKTRREPGTEDLDVVVRLGDQDPTIALEARDEAARATRILQALKPEQQEIIKLAVYHGYSHRSIAEKLGLPLGTVKTHLRRGLLRIREGLHAAGVRSTEEATT